MRSIPACTIATNSYLALASVWSASYRRHHPGAETLVCIVDEPDAALDYAGFPFDIVFIRDLGLPEFVSFVFRYDVLELSTAVKPYLLTYVRDKKGWGEAFYFDPDIFVMDRLDGLILAMNQSAMVLTPHLTAPLDNRYRPPERLIRVTGVYNLGFLGIRLNRETEAFLEWWGDRLRTMCVSELTSGLFVDQGWMAFAPCYLDRVKVVRDTRYNVAYWNLPNRCVERVDGQWLVDGHPIGFFHFSGIDFDHLDEISRHQNRIDLELLPGLRPMFEEYRDRVMQAGHGDLAPLPYSYGNFTPVGVPVPNFLRWLLQEIDPMSLRWEDPFDSSAPDSYFDWISRPFEINGQTINRMALALWRIRSDIRATFPKVPGPDLESYRSWLLDASSRPFTHLHDRFLEPMRGTPDEPWVRPDIDPPRSPTPPRLPRYLSDEWGAHAWVDEELIRCAELNLAEPGEATAWLNQAVEGPHGSSAPFSRLMMALYRRDPELWRRYPDPCGADRAGFAYWVTRCGAENPTLHDDLVRPIRRFLPVRARLGAVLRRSTPDADAARGFRANAGIATKEPVDSGAENDRAPKVGVNFVMSMEFPEIQDPHTNGVAECLRRSGLAVAGVPLSDPLPQILTAPRVRLPEGSPFPLTVVVGDPALAIARWNDLAAGIHVREVAIGFWDGPQVLGLDNPRDISGVVHEVWVHAADDVGPVADATGLPTLHVPPPLLCRRLPIATRDPKPMASGREFMWYAHYRRDCAGDVVELAAVASEIARTRGASWRLMVELEGDTRVVNCARERLAQWPQVEVVPSGRVPPRLDRIAMCDAVIDLHGASPVATIGLAAAMGRIMVGRRSRGMAEVLAPSGEFLVQGGVGDEVGGEELQRVGSALSNGDRVADAAAGVQHFARQRYGIDTAGARVIERITELLPVTR